MTDTLYGNAGLFLEVLACSSANFQLISRYHSCLSTILIIINVMLATDGLLWHSHVICVPSLYFIYYYSSLAPVRDTFYLCFSVMDCKYTNSNEWNRHPNLFRRSLAHQLVAVSLPPLHGYHATLEFERHSQL